MPHFTHNPLATQGARAPALSFLQFGDCLNPFAIQVVADRKTQNPGAQNRKPAEYYRGSTPGLLVNPVAAAVAHHIDQIDLFEAKFP